ncbi:MAG: preprotein translocase subunit SecE [Cyanobacteria bacterium J083]|nr:MAG: preprotein translocase subunit SecE [Cyanobacteria bacterium J083]
MAKKVAAKKEETTKTVKENQTGGLNLSELISGLKEELDKIVWPSRQQLFSESTAVILMITLVATIIYLVDNIFAWIAGKIF